MREMTNRLERRNVELTILNRIAEALNYEVDLPRALQSALENIVKLFDLNTGWIYLLEAETEKYYVAATLHLPPALANHPRRLGGTCHCLDTYRDGDMDGAANINAITCSRLKDLKEGTEGLRYHASIPLYTQTQQLGVLNVASTDWREIADDDLRLLHTVGDLLSIAIQRARLFQKSKEIGAINERNRLAREIHDTIAQGLVAITLQLETADALLESDAEKGNIRQVIAKAMDMTRDNLEEARRSVMDLRAAPLEGRTLPQALRVLLDDEVINATLETRCDVMGSGPPLPTSVAVGIYRIAQEAIYNVKQHSHAQQLRVELISMPEYVSLVIEDDGIGFKPNQIPSGHFGIIGMKERVRLMGGKINISSTPDVGTIIEVNIPLGEKDE